MKKVKKWTITPEVDYIPCIGKNGALRSIILLLAVWVGVSASAQTFSCDGVNYTVLTENTCKTADGSFQFSNSFGGYYTTTAGNDCSGNLTIPGEVEYNGKKYTVNEIGKSSLANNDLKRVELPPSIQKINDGAFYGCALEHIELPNGLKSIGDAAITRLRMDYILIPPSVTYFYEGTYKYEGKTYHRTAITGCRGILYPSGLIGFPSAVKSEESATYPASAHLSDDGWIYTDSGVYYNIPLSMGEIVSVPDDCVGFLWNFKLTPNVKVVDLKNVKDFRISGNTDAILAFDYHYTDSKSPIAYMDDIWKPEANCTFFMKGEDLYCTFISEDGSSETRLFKTGPTTRIEDIDSGTTQITDYAFQKNDLLTEVVIPEGINLLEGSIFAGCSNLKKVELPTTLSKTDYNKNDVDSSPFKNCPNLEEVIVREGPSDICGFNSCPKIEKVFLPATVKTVKFAFNGQALREVEIYANYIEDSFGNSGKAPLKIRMLGVEPAIIENSFKSSLSEWNICGDVPEISLKYEDENFDKYYKECKLVVEQQFLENYINHELFGRMKSICADGKEYAVFNDDHFLYRYNPVKDEAILLGKKSSLQTATIPRRVVMEENGDSKFVNVKTIFYKAFANDTQLRKVSLGTGIENIGERAFYGCTKLEEFEFTPTLLTIGERAFENDTSLVSISLPNQIRVLSEGVFSSCRNLKKVQMPACLDSIGYRAFDNCYALEEVEFNKGLRIIGARAFYKTGLVVLKLPESIESIENDAFSSCSGLEEVEFNEGLKRIGPSAFEETGVISVKLPESLEILDPEAFRECKNLKAVVIGSNCCLGRTDRFSSPITHQFFNCTNLKSVVITDGAKPLEIHKDVFKDVNGIENFHLGRNLIGWYNLRLPNIRTFTVGNSVEKFYYDEAGEYYSLVDLGSSLDTLELGSKVLDIPNYFCQESKLQKVLVPSSVKTIGRGAFANCNLTEIALGSEVTAIGDYAFSGNDNIEKIFITATAPPDANNNVFSAYTATLYTPSTSKGSYVDYPKCWYRFENQIEGLIEPSELKISIPEVQSLKPGATIDLSATVFPLNTTIPTILWSSSNPELATVDHNGKVTVKDYVKISTRGAGQPKADEYAGDNKVVITASTLYADGPIARCEITVDKELRILEIPSADDLHTIEKIDYSQPYDVYNLSGLKVSGTVSNLARGIYIIKQNGNADKMMVP